MPIAKELTIRLEDRPGTLGKACRALADHKVNIVAFQSVLSEGRFGAFRGGRPRRLRRLLTTKG